MKCCTESQVLIEYKEDLILRKRACLLSTISWGENCPGIIHALKSELFVGFVEAVEIYDSLVNVSIVSTGALMPAWFPNISNRLEPKKSTFKISILSLILRLHSSIPVGFHKWKAWKVIPGSH